MKPILLELEYARGAKTWIAQVTGRCKTYGLARDFIAAVTSTDGIREYLLDDGLLYEVCEKDERSFISIQDGKVNAVSKDDAMQIVTDMEERSRKAKEAAGIAIDQAILRFNGEGGFTLN